MGVVKDDGGRPQGKRAGAFVWVVGLTLACFVLTSCAYLTFHVVECPVLGPDDTGYQHVPDWLQFPPPGHPDWAFDRVVSRGVVGVGVDSSGLVYVSHRGHGFPRLTVWNPDGSFNRVFPAPDSILPHYVELDEEDNVWWVDGRGYCIRKVNQDGEVLMTLGECGVEGDDEYHFSGVTDIGWDGEGNLFVTDGDRKNRRVLKYDKDGRFLTQWGSKGSEPGQFDYPHSLWVDPDGTVMVCDRNNGRIQVFDKNGNQLENWTHIVGRPYQIVKNKEGGASCKIS